MLIADIKRLQQTIKQWCGRRHGEHVHDSNMVENDE